MKTIKFTVMVIFAMLFLPIACVDLKEDLGSILTISELKTEADFDGALAPIFAEMADANRNPHWGVLNGIRSQQL